MLTNKELGLYLKNVRELRGMTLRQVDYMANVSYSHLSMIENGARKPTALTLKELARVYNADYIDFYEKAGYVDLAEDMKKPAINPTHLPVLGRIPAGVPIEMIEDIIDYEDISEDMLRGGKEYFALKVKGNSMEPKYLDGDVLIVLKTEDCESGQDAIIAVNGFDATFKRVFKTDQGITLQPLNNEYMPAFYSNEDVKNKPVKILGIVKEIRRTV